MPLLGLADERNRHKPFCEGRVRVVENRAASGAELLAATLFQALVDADALILASLAGNLRDIQHATVNAAQIAIGPAHLLQVIEALIFCGKLLCDVCKLHHGLRKPSQRPRPISTRLTIHKKIATARSTDFLIQSRAALLQKLIATVIRINMP